MPRRLCLHRRLAFPGIDQDRRASALALAALRVAPQAGSAAIARWQGDQAQVWIAAPEALDGVDPTAVLVAESALVPPPDDGDAWRLVKVHEGVEGQVWRGGVLFASRWWPEVPSDEAWGRFMRSAGVVADANAAVPSVKSLGLSSKPWGEAGRRVAWSPAQLEKAFWRTVIVVVAVAIGWQLAAALTWGIAGVWLSSRLEDLRSESAPLIAAREQAEAARARIDALASLPGGLSDYLLLADVRERLPEQARLVSWLRDGDSLRIEVQGTPPDPRLFVQAFRGHPVLAGVVANPLDGGRMQLDIGLDAPEGERP